MKSQATKFRQIIIAVCLSVLCAGQAYADSIKDVTFSALPGDRLQIAIKGDKQLPEPLSFTINSPARLAMDFPNTSSSLAKKSIPVGNNGVKTINVVSAKNRTRVIINMEELAPYSIQSNETATFITIEKANTLSGTNNSTPSLLSANTPTSEDKSSEIQSIDFRRGKSGEGRVILNLSDSNMPVNVQQQGGKVILDLITANIQDNLIQRLDVIDFSTPVKYIDVTKSNSGVRLSVTPLDSNFEHLAYQSDSTFTLELKPISKEAQEKAAKEKFGYTGERLSLNFQDIEVRSVLQLIADFTGLNVVVSDSVSGTLTLRLKNVPWDQALDIILKTKGLDKRKSGNVLLIAPTEEIAQQEKVTLEAKQQVKELAPIRSEFIQVNYAKASELANLVSGEGSSGILSERGSISVDERTNTLLVNDTSATIETVRRLVARLDIPVQQVLIESRIVIANEDFNKELGARFGFSRDAFGTAQTGSGEITSGTLVGTNQQLTDATFQLADRLNFNMPVTSTDTASPGRFGLAIAKLPNDTLIELELSALQSEGNGEIVSTPRVITANQKEAYIEQGVEIPYLEASAGGAATVSFKKAVLSLTVTPQVTPDENVILDLNVKQDSVGDIFQNIPSINTREILTQVLVKNGETIVLGGIFQHETNNTVAKVPFFGDLPLIGRFFRNKSDRENKREILIFVTPKIVRDTLEFN